MFCTLIISLSVIICVAFVFGFNQSTEYAEKLLKNIKDEIALNNYFMESVAKVHGTFSYK